MSQKNKIIMVSVFAFLLGSVWTYVWQLQYSAIGSIDHTPENLTILSTEKKLATNEFVGAVKYNCEKSGGTFDTDMCSCPLEGDQTQEEMYDTTTGYCQTTHGGPGGDAFYSSVGLPYGYYSFWRDIVFAQCETTGGVVSGAACICPEHTVYNTSTGQCNKK